MEKASDDESSSSKMMYLLMAAETEGAPRLGWVLIPQPTPTSCCSKFPQIKIPPPESSMCKQHPSLQVEFGSTVIGSKIYAFGGGCSSCPATKDAARVFDTAHPDTGWIHLPPMLSPRYRPSVVSVPGKIFVIGCRISRFSTLTCFAEVYNLSTKKWEQAIGRSDLGWVSHTNCVYHEDQETILVVISHNRDSFFFGVNQRLDSTPHGFPGYCPLEYAFEFPIVAVNNVAYTVMHGSLYATQLDHGDFIRHRRPVSVKGFPDMVKDCYCSFHCSNLLCHTGDMNFCLIAYVRGILNWLRFHVVQHTANLQDFEAFMDEKHVIFDENHLLHGDHRDLAFASLSF